MLAPARVAERFLSRGLTFLCKESRRSAYLVVSPQCPVGSVSKMEESVKEAEAMIDEDALAARFGCSKRTLQDQRARREGVPFVKVGSLVRYRLEDVERYIAERRVQTGSRPVGSPSGGLGQQIDRMYRRTPVEGASPPASRNTESPSASSHGAAAGSRAGDAGGSESR